MMGGGEEPIMTPEEDERLVSNVLQDGGCAATVTPAVHDLGRDVIAERCGSRLGIQARMVLQANRPVSAAVIMRTYGAAVYTDCAERMIAPDGRPLGEAREVATSPESRSDSSRRSLYDTTGGSRSSAPVELCVRSVRSGRTIRSNPSLAVRLIAAAVVRPPFWPSTPAGCYGKPQTARSSSAPSKSSPGRSAIARRFLGPPECGRLAWRSC
jgi:hypothetical protein